MKRLVYLVLPFVIFLSALLVLHNRNDGFHVDKKLSTQPVYIGMMNKDSLSVTYLSCRSLFNCMQKDFVKGNDSIQYLMYEKLTSLQIDSMASIDTLNQLMEYAEKLQVLSDLDHENSIVYNSVSDHWMNFIASSLSLQQKEETSIKYSFKYQSLVHRLSKYNHHPAVLNSSLEKVISNILNSRFSYLINRIWLRTSLVTKIVLSMLLIFASYIGYLGTREFINRLKQRLKQRLK